MRFEAMLYNLSTFLKTAIGTCTTISGIYIVWGSTIYRIDKGKTISGDASLSIKTIGYFSRAPNKRFTQLSLSLSGRFCHNQAETGTHFWGYKVIFRKFCLHLTTISGDTVFYFYH